MPDWKAEIKTRLGGLRLTAAREAAISDELAQYLDDHYAALLAGGLTEAEAYPQTLTEFRSLPIGMNPRETLPGRARLSAVCVSQNANRYMR